MNKQLIFKAKGWSDYLYWQAQDRKILKRINQLIADIDRNGHKGIGRPEALKYDLHGWWNRRIDGEHRLIYRIEENAIFVAACRFHYEN